MAAIKDLETGRSEHSTPTWPASYYELIATPGTGRHGDLLAVCTIHDEPHVRYICPDGTSWCQALEPHDRRYRARRPRPEPTPAVRVELDVDRLGNVIAEGVVEGFRRARAEQRAERRR